MAETAASLITDALQEILVQAAEQPIEASEMQGAMRYLNRMMAEWDANGIALGYTEVTLPSDVITVPAGAISGMIFNLAISLAQSYDEPISPGLMASAKAGYSAALKLGVTIEPTQFQSTLPVGSGNEDSNQDDRHFYPGVDESVLTESNGNILLESGT